MGLVHVMMDSTHTVLNLLVVNCETSIVKPELETPQMID